MLLDLPFGWNMLYAKTDLLWVMGADTIISFFSAWDHETLSNMTFSCCSLFNVKHFEKVGNPLK